MALDPNSPLAAAQAVRKANLKAGIKSRRVKFEGEAYAEILKACQRKVVSLKDFVTEAALTKARIINAVPVREVVRKSNEEKIAELEAKLAALKSK